MNHEEILARAREIGDAQGQQAWEKVRSYVLGSSCPGKIHYDNARKIVYGLEEEAEITAGILPLPQLAAPDELEYPFSISVGNELIPHYTKTSLEKDLMDSFSYEDQDATRILDDAKRMIRHRYADYSGPEREFMLTVASWMTVNCDGTSREHVYEAARAYLRWSVHSLLEEAAQIYNRAFSERVEKNAYADAKALCPPIEVLHQEEDLPPDPDSLPGGHDFIREHM